MRNSPIILKAQIHKSIIKYLKTHTCSGKKKWNTSKLRYVYGHIKTNGRIFREPQ